MPVLEQQVVPNRERTRADEAHLAPEDVQSLGNLVEREPAQHAPDARDPGIVADLEERAADLVRLLQLALVLGGVGDHRPELQHPELALPEPDAPVAVEDRPRRRELDRERDEQPQRKADEDHGAADADVECALDDPVGAGEGRLPQLEQRHALPGNELGTLRDQLRRLRRDPHLHAGAMSFVAQAQKLLRVEIGVGDDQLVGLVRLEHVRQVVDGAEKRQLEGRLRGSDRAEEVVLDSASAVTEVRVQACEVVARADEHGASLQAGQPEDVPRDDVVARREASRSEPS